MKHILFLLILTPLFLFSQIDTLTPDVPDLRFIYKKNVQFELFGSAGLYSINYERIILNQNKYKTVGGIGFSRIPISAGNGASFPISINHLISFQHHHIELGIGAVPNYVSDYLYPGWHIHYSARIGYRYQKPYRKFIFRVGAVPIFAFPGFGVWGAINFGYGF